MIRMGVGMKLTLVLMSIVSVVEAPVSHIIRTMIGGLKCCETIVVGDGSPGFARMLELAVTYIPS
jgi:hypothetical protein